jgi:hypothetical protein
MLTKSIISIAAVLASLAAIPAGAAQAHSNVDFSVGVGFGVGGFYPGYGYGGYYAPVYAEPY